MTPLNSFICTARVFDSITVMTGSMCRLTAPTWSARRLDMEQRASFTPKMDGDAVRSVAFCCTAVTPRG